MQGGRVVALKFVEVGEETVEIEEMGGGHQLRPCVRCVGVGVCVPALVVLCCGRRMPVRSTGPDDLVNGNYRETEHGD